MDAPSATVSDQQAEDSVTTGRLLRKLVKAGAEANSEEFRRVAEQMIQQEREKNHHLLASDLERILYGVTYRDSSRVGPHAEVPRDQERGLPLLEVREPVRDLDDIVLSGTNQRVVDAVLLEQSRRDLLGSYGLRALNRLLFCGPPGCGKTLAAEVLATELGLPLTTVRFDAVISSFLGQTAANLRQVFDFIAEHRVVALFDEFDAIGKERTDDAEHGELRRVVNSFLQMLDAYRGQSILVAATNHEGLLDSALWRRFDEVAMFERPTTPQLRQLLSVKLRGVRYEFDTADEQLLSAFKGMSHGDVERILIRSIKDMVLKGREFLVEGLVRDALTREADRLRLMKLAGGSPD